MEYKISPEEMAKEIFESMHSALPSYAIFSAKECSKICVNRIKSTLENKTGEDDSYYWDEVSKEIKKF